MGDAITSQHPLLYTKHVKRSQDSRDGGRDGGSSGAGLSAKVRRDVGAADGRATVDVERAYVVIKSPGRVIECRGGECESDEVS